MSLLRFEVVPAEWPTPYDFENDLSYRRLTADMSDRDIHFCRRYALDANGAGAIRATTPQLQADSAKSAASRLLKDENIRGLIDYLKRLPMTPPAPAEPVTLEEIAQRLETAFRTCTEPKTLLLLADEIMRLRQLKLSALGQLKPPTLGDVRKFAAGDNDEN